MLLPAPVAPRPAPPVARPPAPVAARPTAPDTSTRDPDVAVVLTVVVSPVSASRRVDGAAVPSPDGVLMLRARRGLSVRVRAEAQLQAGDRFAVVAGVGYRVAGALRGGAGGVRVAFWLGAARTDAWTTLFHLTQADVLVGSASHFSFWAGQLASKPLVLAQEDMDRWRLCGEGAACCLRDGRCSFYAGVRMREAARRLAALLECGGMEEEEEEQGQEEEVVAST